MNCAEIRLEQDFLLHFYANVIIVKTSWKV